MSSSPLPMKQKITPIQFWCAIIALSLCAVAAFVALAGVAGKHGICPSETQTSRPAASSCYEAYQQQSSTGAIG